MSCCKYFVPRILACKRWQMKAWSEQTGFNLTELLSLHFSQQFPNPLVGTPFWQGNRSVFQKIKAALGENAIRYIDKLTAGPHTIHIGASDYQSRGNMIDRLLVAIEDHKVTLITYQSMLATEPVEQEV